MENDKLYESITKITAFSLLVNLQRDYMKIYIYIAVRILYRRDLSTVCVLTTGSFVTPDNPLLIFFFPIGSRRSHLRQESKRIVRFVCLQRRLSCLGDLELGL